MSDRMALAILWLRSLLAGEGLRPAGTEQRDLCTAVRVLERMLEHARQNAPQRP